MDYQNLKIKIKHSIPFLLGKHKGSGLLPNPIDGRDFQLGSIWGNLFGTYEPLHQRKEIQTISIKDQKRINTCGWCSSVVQKEVDEGVELSVRGNVVYGKRNGLLSGDGYSYLRNNQKVLVDFGAQEEKDLPDIGHGNWNEYSVSVLDMVKAGVHKAQSFWTVSNRNELFKLLDENRVVQAGMEWFSGFNQGGGFKSPWLIDKSLGFSVGGHAIAIIGYDLNYQGKQVYIIQNSYGEQWGDNGKFYVEMSYMDRQMFSWGGYGCYATLDIQPDLGSFLNQYDGKNVKAQGEPTIYLIQKGVKKPYLHEMDYFAFNVEDSMMKNFEIVDKQLLDKVKKGDNMDIKKSIYWPLLKHLEKPLNLTRIVEAIKLNK
jgi:hypothetical protein